MANKTFLQLQTTLASMWGYEDVAELLDQDLIDIKSWINAALFDCYVPVDGTRATWPEQYHADILKAPVTVTLGLTNGSKVVTGHAFEDKFAGSFVKIGERFFRYSGKTVVDLTTTYYLMQPWDQATGSYAATVYHNAIALPFNVVEMAGMPNLVGIGLLGALPDPDAELLLRTEPAFDFQSRESRSVFAIARNQFRQSAYYDVGDPRFYHIDQASVAPSFAIGNRLHVYPIPEHDYTFELRANIVPTGLTADADIPALPWQTVDNILLPLAREKLVENTAGRRYTGPNVQLIMNAANRARQQLSTMRRVQRDVAGSVRMKANW